MWRAITAVALVIAILAGSGVYLGYTLGPDQPPPLAPGPRVTRPPVPQTKPSEPPEPEGTQVATPVDLGTLVPVATAPPPGVTCPPDWLFFDNPALHYSICYPPGWGFSDFSTPDPLAAVPVVTLSSVNILSQDAFPYSADIHYTERPPDVKARLGQTVTVNVEAFPPGAGLEGCQPSIPVAVGPLSGLFCEDVYDILPGPEVRFSPSGQRHTLRVFLPLPQPPDLDLLARDLPSELRDIQPKSGWQLLVSVTGQASRYPVEKDLQWQIVNSIRVY